MELIHADASMHELGVLDFERFDGVTARKADLDSNDWEVRIPAEDFARVGVAPGHFLYFPGTEWGGEVEKIRHESRTRTVHISGVGWRGMLVRRVVTPPAGQTHLDLRETELGAAMTALLGDGLGGLFQVATTGTGLTAGLRFRYPVLLDALNELLDAHDRRLVLSLDSDSGRVLLDAQPVVDHSEDVELSGDYDLSYTSTRGVAQYNHVIALGGGEQADRIVRHLYLLPDGSVTDDASADGVATGRGERVLLYDYANSEDETELLRGAKKRLLEYAAQNTIEFRFDSPDIDLPLGDRVGLRDRLTGMADVRAIVRKLLTVSADGVQLQYEVE